MKKRIIIITSAIFCLAGVAVIILKSMPRYHEPQYFRELYFGNYAELKARYPVAAGDWRTVSVYRVSYDGRGRINFAEYFEYGMPARDKFLTAYKTSIKYGGDNRSKTYVYTDEKNLPAPNADGIYIRKYTYDNKKSEMQLDEFGNNRNLLMAFTMKLRGGKTVSIEFNDPSGNLKAAGGLVKIRYYYDILGRRIKEEYYE